jgi:DNA-binding response OmpR family regulator
MANILIAEDEAHIVRVLALWLSRNGHRIIEASDGQKALEAVDREPVELIISDMNMPVLDGLEFAKVLREQKKVDIPFLMLSSRSDQARLADMVKGYGVTLYPKPFVPSRLVAEIDRLLEAPFPVEAGVRYRP